MTETSHDVRLLRTFAALADTLVDDYDVVELLQSLVDACGEHLDVSAAGILLADEGGDLEVIASTDESSRLVELLHIGAVAGPCLQCFRTGLAVELPSIADAPNSWHEFVDRALADGYAAADSIPLRLRENTIGTLSLLRAKPGGASDFDLAAARAFADVATIGILHERSIRESEVLTEQLQHALRSRVLIEQAKGVVSYTNSIPVDEAFTLIRRYARRHRLTLSEVAARLVNRDLLISDGDA